MVSFNDKIIEIFGAWVTDYAPVLLLAALGLALLFFITVIAAIVRACVLKSKIKKLQAENAKAANAVSGAELQLRADNRARAKTSAYRRTRRTARRASVRIRLGLFGYRADRHERA